MLRFRKKQKVDFLDQPILNWNKKDSFRVRDLLNGGICIFGGSGSGKTSGSGKHLAHSIVGLGNSGGLICAAKPEDAAMWRNIFAQHGREDDLIVFEPDGDWRFNFIASEMRNGGHTRNIVRCMMTLAETLDNGESGGGEDGGFWIKGKERFLYNAIEVLKQAEHQVTAPNLQLFFNSAAYNLEQIQSPEWQAEFHNQTLKKAFTRVKSQTETYDYQQAMEFWLKEFPLMADKTRSSILAGVFNLLHVFNTGLVRELVSTRTNVTPDVMFDRKFVLVNMPPSEFKDLGKFVNSGWKYLTQQAILRRHANPDDAIVVIWCDEAQDLVTSMDTPFLAQCRSHYGCMVYLAQSLPAYLAVLKGDTGEQQVKALMANFQHKIAHALGDTDTAEFFSGLVGRELTTFTGGSSSPSTGMFDEIFGPSTYSGNFSEQYENALQPKAFMHGLRTGGAVNGGLVDGFLVRSGRPFSNGKNYLRVTFAQEQQ